MARRRRRSSSTSTEPILVIMAIFIVGYVIIDKGWDKKFLEIAGSWDVAAERKYGLVQYGPCATPQHNARHQPFFPPTEYSAPGPVGNQGGYW